MGCLEMFKRAVPCYAGDVTARGGRGGPWSAAHRRPRLRKEPEGDEGFDPIPETIARQR